MDQSIDILILSNGPGEITTWVRPVVQELGKQLSSGNGRVRISLILSPCPNATGKEVTIARSYPEIDRVQGAEHFFKFLLFGKTAENWDWFKQGVVLFLGGDQFFTLLIAKKLGYKSVIYAEWDARWWRFIDRFGVMKAEIINTISEKYANKFTVVGDLMADVGAGSPYPTSAEILPGSDLLEAKIRSPLPPLLRGVISHLNSWENEGFDGELIGLLPGSKAAKLAQGVPLTLAIAEEINKKRPQTHFVIPVAPTLDLTTLAKFADPQQNPILEKFGGVSGQLVQADSPFLETNSGLKILLWTQTPAYDLLTQCSLCLTTVGANTAELGSLAVPMIVLLPTQQLDAMRSWDGIPGLLANLPGVGSVFAKMINGLVLRQGRLFAWPNIWAKAEIVPELVGKLEADKIADLVLNYLDNPEKLEEMRDHLRQVRGEPGAAAKLVKVVLEEVEVLKAAY